MVEKWEGEKMRGWEVEGTEYQTSSPDVHRDLRFASTSNIQYPYLPAGRQYSVLKKFDP